MVTSVLYNIGYEILLGYWILLDYWILLLYCTSGRYWTAGPSPVLYWTMSLPYWTAIRCFPILYLTYFRASRLKLDTLYICRKIGRAHV